MNTAYPALILAILFVSACSNSPKNQDDPGPYPARITIENAVEDSAEALYLKAKELLDRKQYETAVGNFENLEATFPFSDYAAQARLDIAYAYYKISEFEGSIAAADRFLKQYPQSEKADYAYYLKGLANFSRGKSVLDSLVSRKLYRMDQSALRTAFADFSTLVTRFPESGFAEDAATRMELLQNEMARHELHTAEYYFKRSAMVAVINRVNTMLETYPDSAYAADALALLARAYISLGNRSMAADTVKALQLEQPGHPALRALGGLVG